MLEKSDFRHTRLSSDANISSYEKDILTFRKKRWIGKEKYFYTKSTSFWTPKYGVPPIALRLQRNGVKMSTMDKIVSLKKHSPSNWYSVFYS